jgi:hypothetical protein
MAPGKIFNRQIAIADLQAVNGQRVMGVHTRVGTLIGLVTAPSPGHAIADIVRNAAVEISFEILKSDGTPIGTIMASGFNGGASAPGSPSRVAVANFVVTGGTGAFLGARGQVGAEDPPPGVSIQRGASITEDPANRRLNGGGTQRWVVHLIHSDFSAVSNGFAIPGQFAGRSKGEWEAGRSNQQHRLAGIGGHLPDRFPGA